MKKVLSTLLIAAMLLCGMSTVAFADEVNSTPAGTPQYQLVANPAPGEVEKDTEVTFQLVNGTEPVAATITVTKKGETVPPSTQPSTTPPSTVESTPAGTPASTPASTPSSTSKDTTDPAAAVVTEDVTFVVTAFVGGKQVAAGEFAYTVKKTVSPGTSYVPTDALAANRTQANTAVSAAATANKYDEPEQAEIAKIIEKAKADIAAAKTAEEIKAIQDAAIKEIEAVLTAEEKATIAQVKESKFVARSVMSTLNGKKAVKVTWTTPEGVEFDGYDIFRSTERYKGFGTKPYFSTTNKTYKNNKALKKGNTYYYKVRGYKVVNGEKVYSQWSTKAWRTVK